jgi:glycosyltransferase involved in cell wall biosynthesis
MRILVVHNNYSSRVPSGENAAVEDEVAWCRAAGIDVHVHSAHNDSAVEGSKALKVQQAAEAVWSISARQSFGAELDRIRPDLVHVHNLFPLISGSVPRLALRRGLPVLWTVHNNRILCVGGANFRDGAPCHQCSRHWRVPGIRHACYSNSSTASALVTGASSLFGRLARKRIPAIAISESVRRWLVDTAGFRDDQVTVKYNGIAPPEVVDDPGPAQRRAFLFAGRLEGYKGVRLLLDAWQRAVLPADAELRLAGDGELADDVRQAAAADPRITWLGFVPPDQLSRLMVDARAVVVPSTWEETFGRVAAEAMAHGRPVVTTGRGGLSELIDETTGWVTGTDVDALAKALTIVADADGDHEVGQRGAAARLRYQQRFSPEATTAALIGIYEAAIADGPG